MTFNDTLNWSSGDESLAAYPSQMNLGYSVVDLFVNSNFLL